MLRLCQAVDAVEVVQEEKAAFGRATLAREPETLTASTPEISKGTHTFECLSLFKQAPGVVERIRQFARLSIGRRLLFNELRVYDWMGPVLGAEVIMDVVF